VESRELSGLYVETAFFELLYHNSPGLPWTCCLCCRSLPEIEQLLLLPDRDPRLTALLPALQRSTSNVSSTGLPVHGTTAAGGSDKMQAQGG